ncbi:GntR family transcriptional regulator, partial [Clostridioides difficile]|uniref:GntR family transcriptional regulator n=1 Tax=Clostridioides difficile TaxID=1496 RepID=UPI003F8D090E
NPMQYVSIPKTKSKTETNKVKTITLEEFNQILNIFPQDSFQRLKNRIENKEYLYQDLLPSEYKLIEEYSCSRNTIRRAIQELAN